MTTTRNVPDLREASETYAHEVCRQDLFRVILCRDHLQWIIQTASEARPTIWIGKSFCTTRAALIREWQHRVQGPIPEAVTKLPERITLIRS